MEGKVEGKVGEEVREEGEVRWVVMVRLKAEGTVGDPKVPRSLKIVKSI